VAGKAVTRRRRRHWPKQRKEIIKMAEDFQDLQEFLDRKNNEVLNAVKQNPLSNVLFGKDRDDEKKIIKSDSDEQLLITVNFSTVVKLKAIQVSK